MPLANQVSALASRVAQEIKLKVDKTDPRLSDTRVPTGWVDVKKAGAVGDGTADDAAAIQAAIDGSAVGSIIWFPAGTYRVTSCIRLKPGRTYMGPGGRAQLATVKAATGVSGAVMAAEGWWTNATLCDNGIRVESLLIDASSLAGIHGLVVYNFWSTIRDVQVTAVNNANGMHVTDKGRNGSTITTNSHSENIFENLRFYDFTNLANGFYAESNNGYSNQDGHLRNSFFAGIEGYAVRVTRAAGWSIVDNHLYGIGLDGINLDNCYATKVQSNYVEDFGGQNAANPGAPTYGYYSGIALNTVLDTRASIVSDNTVSASQAPSPLGNRFSCFVVRAGSEQLRANVVMSGNTAVFAVTAAPTVARTYAYWLGEPGDTGRMLNVEWAGNQVENIAWWQGVRNVADPTVTLTENGALVLRRTMTTDLTVTLPATANGLRIEAVASGATRTVTIPASVKLSTGLTSRTFSVPSGQVFSGYIDFSELANAWVLVAATVSS